MGVVKSQMLAVEENGGKEEETTSKLVTKNEVGGNAHLARGVPQPDKESATKQIHSLFASWQFVKCFARQRKVLGWNVSLWL